MDGFAPSTVHKSDLFYTNPLPPPPPPPPHIPPDRPPTRSSHQNRSRTSPASISISKTTPPPPPPLPLKVSDLGVHHASTSSSAGQPPFPVKLDSQEEAELARALAESMRISDPYPSLSSPGAGPSKPPSIPHHSRPESTSSSHSGIWSSTPSQASASLLDDDEALARKIAADEERDELLRRDGVQRPSSEDDAAYARQLEEDEALARQLALEEEGDDKHSDANSAHATARPPSPPPYADAASPPNPSVQTKSSLSVQSSLFKDIPSFSSHLARSENLAGSLQPASASPLSLKEQLEADRLSAMINVNQFVDKELFLGVSIGFWDPVLVDRPGPMASVMPNIISLPYGKSPPLHLQATSWRHLLKLMVRLSGTRIEPTLDATQRNEPLHLRTVVQFVRAHYTSHTWQTIVWFTLDQDSERSLIRRNPAGDNESLPYSYYQMKLPALLRHGSDSDVSKVYTIPSTHTVPYPTLPITFPNLTVYLQAALEESRRYLNDSSSGMRKFAKMLQSCYPEEFDVGMEPGQRSGVSGLFKKVIGRSGRSKKKGQGGNEETYDLVTPFVPDEWG
ncbi:hypothetical protein D9757_002656 [Collybiopsis confluens]|uniref:Uncharacterized protein n=1 Tax=Collybiopsis confluens TaxID=2823264 RepID=A0A8H5HW45_9AGAR|nr:hypothetical protein D9757_002656 [Collybiopsis confluens]